MELDVWYGLVFLSGLALFTLGFIGYLCGKLG